MSAPDRMSGASEDGPMNDRSRRIKADPARARVRRAVPPSNSIVTRSSAYQEPQAREAMIAEAAYHRSAHRGFEPGHEVDDWLAAESEIEGALARGDLPLFEGCA
jgi:hypothetical protein